jgi:hypothetical protein
LDTIQAYLYNLRIFKMNWNQLRISPRWKDSEWKNMRGIHKSWSVRDIKIFHWDKQWAIERAQQIAKNQGLETKVQNLNGRISWGNSYWNDPCPPKDTRP